MKAHYQLSDYVGATRFNRLGLLKLLQSLSQINKAYPQKLVTMRKTEY